MKDLPPGAGALMKEATMQGDYAKAEEIFQQILQQDQNNVYVLGFLAHAQFVLGQLPECEKTVARALALDPEDPASLMWLGILRYRQDKLDEALTALSLSAKFASTNAATQYYLGRVLAEKGLRPAAETAFRKALETDPRFADAHFSLAFVYAAEKPPSLELARWHYQRAVDLGHGKSPELEKLLAASP
jgi:tetratricopeptide (TPR) repeat protein